MLTHKVHLRAAVKVVAVKDRIADMEGTVKVGVIKDKEAQVAQAEDPITAMMTMCARSSGIFLVV